MIWVVSCEQEEAGCTYTNVELERTEHDQETAVAISISNAWDLNHSQDRADSCQQTKREDEAETELNSPVHLQSADEWDWKKKDDDIADDRHSAQSVVRRTEW